jgi:hypothetical protein
MFEQEYKISEQSPLYLLLQGNKQIGLLSLALAQFKDARDQDIGKSNLVGDIFQVYKAVSELAKKENVEMPISADFEPFFKYLVEENKISPMLLIEKKTLLSEMEEENDRADEERRDQPYSSDEIDPLKDIVTALRSDYASVYIPLVMKSDIPIEQKNRTLKMIDDFTDMRYEKHKVDYVGGKYVKVNKQPTEQMINIWTTIGKYSKQSVLDGDRTFESMRMFRRYLPNEFLDFVRAQDPTQYKNYPAIMKQVIDDTHAPAYKEGPFKMDVSKQNETIMEMYGKYLSSTASKNLQKDSVMVGRDFIDLPTKQGQRILKDGDEFYLVKVKNKHAKNKDLTDNEISIRIIAHVNEYAGHAHNNALKIARALGVHGGYNMEVADLIYRATVAVYYKLLREWDLSYHYQRYKTIKIEWEYMLDEYRRNTIDWIIGTDPFGDPESYARGKSEPLPSEENERNKLYMALKNTPKTISNQEYMYRLLNYNGNIAYLFGDEVAIEIESAFQTVKSDGQQIRQPESVMAWLNRQCKFAMYAS